MPAIGLAGRDGMTGPRVLRADDHVQMPWANGGGTTHEVLAWPEGAALVDIGWRISLADVDASGPFSVLPGIDRILVVIEGTGMDLTVDGRTTSLRLFEPIAFAGEATTSCTLTAGPTRDLNVMVRRGVATASLVVVGVTDAPLAPDPYATTVVVVLEGTCEVACMTGVLGLAPRDALVLSRPGRWSGAATLAVVTIRHEPGTL